MSGIEPSRWLRIVQTGLFLKKWSSLGLDDDDLIVLEEEILRGRIAIRSSEGPVVCRRSASLPRARRGVRAGPTECATRISHGAAWSSC
jgi:hypothetical protein